MVSVGLFFRASQRGEFFKIYIQMLFGLKLYFHVTKITKVILFKGSLEHDWMNRCGSLGYILAALI